MPEYLPRAPKTYDAAQLDKMFEALLSKIAEFSQALTEVASDNNRAIGLLPDNRLYQLIDADRKSVVLALKSRGRLHRVQMESSGVSSPSGGVAPADAQYIVSVADAGLANADVLTGTANQITVTNGSGASTLSTPQNLHTATNWQCNNIEIDADLNHDGANVGFYGTAPTARPSAYTQTYSTATRTHANLTAAALTDSSGGTANTTIQALTDPVDTPASADALRDDLVANLIPALRNNFADLAAQINALITDVTNTKQVLNSVLDDGQTLGLLQ